MKSYGTCSWKPIWRLIKSKSDTPKPEQHCLCRREHSLLRPDKYHSACFTKLADKCWLPWNQNASQKNDDVIQSGWIHLETKSTHINSQLRSSHSQAGKVTGKDPLWSTAIYRNIGHRVNRMSLGSKHSKPLSCLWLFTCTEGPTANSHPNVAGLIKAMPAMPAMLNHAEFIGRRLQNALVDAYTVSICQYL